MFNKKEKEEIQQLRQELDQLKSEIKYNFGLYDFSKCGFQDNYQAPKPINVMERIRLLCYAADIEAVNEEIMPFYYRKKLKK